MIATLAARCLTGALQARRAEADRDAPKTFMAAMRWLERRYTAGYRLSSVMDLSRISTLRSSSSYVAVMGGAMRHTLATLA